MAYGFILEGIYIEVDELAVTTLNHSSVPILFVSILSLCKVIFVSLSVRILG